MAVPIAVRPPRQAGTQFAWILRCLWLVSEGSCEPIQPPYRQSWQEWQGSNLQPRFWSSMNA